MRAVQEEGGMTDAQKGAILRAAFFAAVAAYFARFALLQWREGEAGIWNMRGLSTFCRRSENPFGFWMFLGF